MNEFNNFNEIIPNEGDLIIIIHPPEQMTLPDITVFHIDKTEWIDGDKWSIYK